MRISGAIQVLEEELAKDSRNKLGHDETSENIIIAIFNRLLRKEGSPRKEAFP